MTPKQQTLTEVLTACAGATVPCLGCKGKGRFYKGSTEDGSTEALAATCLSCSGTGRCYILGDEVRIPCPCLRGEFACEPCQPMCIVHSDGCAPCQGRSWVPNSDQDACRRAVRSLNWMVNVESRPWPADPYLGDEVHIRELYGKNLALVTHHDRLRDFLAFTTALKRALEQMPGVEMGGCLLP